jgi:flagellar motor component MotA
MSRSLPQNPSIEQLKKQAKEFQSSFAAGDANALELVATLLPRLQGSAAEQLGQERLSLQEAQHVLALDYGFLSWNWLHAVVEIDFDLLARLTDQEIQISLRGIDQKDLVAALTGASDTAQAAVLSNMSERVRQFIQEEMGFLGPGGAEQAPEIQRRIIQYLHKLAQDGHLSWPNGEIAGAGADRRRARMKGPHLTIDFLRHRLSDLGPEQVAEMWQGIAEQARREGILSLEPLLAETAEPFVQEAVQLAVDGTEPDLIDDILRTRLDCVLLPPVITRSNMVVEALMAIQSGDNPRVVLHKLSALFQTFDQPLGPEGGLNIEITPEQLAARLQCRPFAEQSNADRAVLLAEIACLARARGIAALAPLADATDDPPLESGIRLLVDENPPPQGEFMEALSASSDAQVLGAKAPYIMCIVAVRMVQGGRPPEEIAAAAMEAAQETLHEED